MVDRSARGGGEMTAADRSPAKAPRYAGPPTMGLSMQAVRVRFVDPAARYDERARAYRARQQAKRMSAPIRVAQVVDGDTLSVLLTIDATRTVLEPGGTAVTVALTPDKATVLDLDLYEANREPIRCDFDDRYSVVVVDGAQLCDRHARSLDHSRQASS